MQVISIVDSGGLVSWLPSEVKGKLQNRLKPFESKSSLKGSKCLQVAAFVESLALDRHPQSAASVLSYKLHKHEAYRNHGNRGVIQPSSYYFQQQSRSWLATAVAFVPRQVAGLAWLEVVAQFKFNWSA